MQSSVHSYSVATLSELFEHISQYTPQNLKTVIAGFNDNRSNPQQFADDWKCLLDTIYMNFNPSTVILTKSILSVYQPHINQKLFALNNALQFLLFKFYPSVVTLSFDNIHDFTFFSSLEMVHLSLSMAIRHFLDCFVS